jgi:hypothetical protein
VAAEGVGEVGFLADLAAVGVEATLEHGVVLYQVIATSGALIGASVDTGVGVSELQGWPAVPPHWLHFPASVQFATTNADQTEVLPGWQRHSRDIGQWDMSRPPIQSWLAHVRGVIASAIADAA